MIPSLHIDYENTRIKQYHKEGRTLKTETTINNTRDADIGKLLRLCGRSAFKPTGVCSTSRRFDPANYPVGKLRFLRRLHLHGIKAHSAQPSLPTHSRSTPHYTVSFQDLRPAAPNQTRRDHARPRRSFHLHSAPHSTGSNRKSAPAARRSGLLLRLDAFELRFHGQKL